MCVCEREREREKEREGETKKPPEKWALLARYDKESQSRAFSPCVQQDRGEIGSLSLFEFIAVKFGLPSWD